MKFVEACLIAAIYFHSKGQLRYFWLVLALSWVDLGLTLLLLRVA